MSHVVDVGAAGELGMGTMKEVKVESRELLVARVGDTYYAADGRCPHMHAHLARGRLEGTVVTCPFHGSQFDLRDGRIVRWTRATGFMLRVAKTVRAPRVLKTYPAEARDGRLLIELD